MTDQNYCATILWRFRQIRRAAPTTSADYAWNYAIELCISRLKKYHDATKYSILDRNYAYNKSVSEMLELQIEYARNKDEVAVNAAVSIAVKALREFYYEQEIKT